MYKETNTIFKTKRIRLFALMIKIKIFVVHVIHDTSIDHLVVINGSRENELNRLAPGRRKFYLLISNFQTHVKDI